MENGMENAMEIGGINVSTFAKTRPNKPAL